MRRAPVPREETVWEMATVWFNVLSQLFSIWPSSWRLVSLLCLYIAEIIANDVQVTLIFFLGLPGPTHTHTCPCPGRRTAEAPSPSTCHRLEVCQCIRVIPKQINWKNLISLNAAIWGYSPMVKRGFWNIAKGGRGWTGGQSVAIVCTVPAETFNVG